MSKNPIGKRKHLVLERKCIPTSMPHGLIALILVLADHWGNELAWFVASGLCVAIAVLYFFAMLVEMPVDIFEKYRGDDPESNVPPVIGEETK